MNSFRTRLHRVERSGLGCCALAVGTLFLLGGNAAAQTAQSGWAAQPTAPVTLSASGQTYTDPFVQSYTTPAGPTCFNPSASTIVANGPCSPTQISNGDVTAATNANFLNQKTPITQVPTAAVAPGSQATINVQNEYADSQSPTGVSYINAQIPLSQFATASSVTQESQRALTSEANLAAAIFTESQARAAAVARVTQGYRAATAAAIALGGAGLLPGKRLNLTLNVGEYEGEWAFAAQGAVLVNDHALLNAGVTTASGGGTGARAGITFGW